MFAFAPAYIFFSSCLMLRTSSSAADSQRSGKQTKKHKQGIKGRNGVGPLVNLMKSGGGQVLYCIVSIQHTYSVHLRQQVRACELHRVSKQASKPSASERRWVAARSGHEVYCGGGYKYKQKLTAGALGRGTPRGSPHQPGPQGC